MEEEHIPMSDIHKRSDNLIVRYKDHLKSIIESRVGENWSDMSQESSIFPNWYWIQVQCLQRAIEVGNRKGQMEITSVESVQTIN